MTHAWLTRCDNVEFVPFCRWLSLGSSHKSSVRKRADDGTSFELKPLVPACLR